MAAVLATVLACISFLAGTTYTDHARSRAYRQLVEERRELNAMLLYSMDSPPPSHRSAYAAVHPRANRRATLLQPYDDDLTDD